MPQTQEISRYIAELNRQYQTNIAREHAYRPALKQLLETMLPNLIVLNDPKRQDCGAPDFILLRNKDSIPVAFIETKDLNDPDLAGRNRNREQFERYKQSLGNIIFTDYLDFRFYENGESTNSIRIAELNGDKLTPVKENFEKFESLINGFGKAEPQRIESSAKLADIMAGKARLMAEVILNSLLKDHNQFQPPSLL